jgi:hypothetical protein
MTRLRGFAVFVGFGPTIATGNTRIRRTPIPVQWARRCSRYRCR